MQKKSFFNEKATFIFYDMRIFHFWEYWNFSESNRKLMVSEGWKNTIRTVLGNPMTSCSIKVNKSCSIGRFLVEVRVLCSTASTFLKNIELSIFYEYFRGSFWNSWLSKNHFCEAVTLRTVGTIESVSVFLLFSNKTCSRTPKKKKYL